MKLSCLVSKKVMTMPLFVRAEYKKKPRIKNRYHYIIFFGLQLLFIGNFALDFQ